jgi:hypothetical protein
VRAWADDLWLFPYYLDGAFVPHDARPGGPARAAWPDVEVTAEGRDAQASAAAEEPVRTAKRKARTTTMIAIAVVAAGILAAVAAFVAIKLRLGRSGGG